MTGFAFKKTTALLFAVISIGIAGQALKNQAHSADKQQPEQSQSTIQATVAAQQEEETTTGVGIEQASTVRIYDIPLSEELQAFTFNLCQEYGVDYEMVLAIMGKESNYTASAVSENNDYGIMQINKANHKWLTEELGITDFLDPEQNIRGGVYILALLTEKYNDPHQVLMAYNMGERGAREYVAKGHTSSAYSRYIMQLRDKLLQEREKK